MDDQIAILTVRNQKEAGFWRRRLCCAKTTKYAFRPAKNAMMIVGA
jgi:hypothetical protein